jgi:hypothetical protein
MDFTMREVSLIPAGDDPCNLMKSVSLSGHFRELE